MVNQTTYNPWPLGNVPESLQRPELKELHAKGYQFDDAREVIDIFERKLAKFADCKYAVTVDCCTHALELCFRYLFITREIQNNSIVIPDNTYISIYWMLVQLGMKPILMKQEWSGCYEFGGTRIIDAAVRWKEDMYLPDTVAGVPLQCVSFQIKKPLPIGRGGAILTNDEKAYQWLKLARYDGRDMEIPYDQPRHIKMPGYHYYMTPEDAARGILLMNMVKFSGDSANHTNYPSITEMIKDL